MQVKCWCFFDKQTNSAQLSSAGLSLDFILLTFYHKNVVRQKKICINMSHVLVCGFFPSISQFFEYQKCTILKIVNFVLSL